MKRILPFALAMMLPLVALMALWPRDVGAQAPVADCPEAAISADFALSNGRFYTQAAGQPGRGFAVTDDAGVRFWSEFQRLGGVAGVGYPISQRFVWDGFVSQAFQKMVFQWRPEVDQVYAVNIVDIMHEQGLDGWLQLVRATPPMADWSSDTGKPWPEVVEAHQALLTDPDIRATYFAVADPITLYGLPMAPIQDMGNVLVLRAQRGIIQKWLVDTPWAQAGQVTVANSGDVAKEAQVLPTDALSPADPTPGAAVPAESPMGVVGIGLPPPASPDLIQRQAQDSALVVVGTVQDVSPPRWNTPDGRRPANPNQGIPGQCARIFTVVTLEVRSYLKGSDPRTIISFTKPGGRIGEDYIDVGPDVDYRPGDQIIAFLQPAPDSQQLGLPPGTYSAGRGRFLVRPGDVVVDGWQPSWTMPLDEFAALVASAA